MTCHIWILLYHWAPTNGTLCPQPDLRNNHFVSVVSMETGTIEQNLYLNINLFLKVTFSRMSVHGHTRYKSFGTCHLPSFPLVHTHVGEQLFLFSTHCFLLLAAILRGETSVSAEYETNPMRLSLVFEYVMYIMVSFNANSWFNKLAKPA